MHLNRYVVHITYIRSGTGAASAATATQVETHLNYEQLVRKYEAMVARSRVSMAVDIISLGSVQ